MKDLKIITLTLDYVSSWQSNAANGMKKLKANANRKFKTSANYAFKGESVAQASANLTNEVLQDRLET